MIIFRNDNDSSFPSIPVWVLKEGKLSGEDFIELYNACGEVLKIDRNSLSQKYNHTNELTTKTINGNKVIPVSVLIG